MSRVTAPRPLTPPQERGRRLRSARRSERVRALPSRHERRLSLLGTEGAVRRARRDARAQTAERPPRSRLRGGRRRQAAGARRAIRAADHEAEARGDRRDDAVVSLHPEVSRRGERPRTRARDARRGARWRPSSRSISRTSSGSSRTTTQDPARDRDEARRAKDATAGIVRRARSRFPDMNALTSCGVAASTAAAGCSTRPASAGSFAGARSRRSHDRDRPRRDNG